MNDPNDLNNIKTSEAIAPEDVAEPKEGQNGVEAS